MSALDRLRTLVADEGEPLAGALGARCGPVSAPTGVDGPRVQGRVADYELLLEAIYEGYLLHYGTSRLLADADADLALLAGDRLYALGLERLVALGDLEAVGELADLIALCALLTARGDGAMCDSVWRAAVHAVGWGSTPEHARAKALARSGDPGAAVAFDALGHPLRAR